MTHRYATFLLAGALAIGVATPLCAQDSAAVVTPPADTSLAAEPDSNAARPRKARPGSEFRIPVGSVLLPGLGQYLQGAPLAGLGYTAAAATGAAVGLATDAGAPEATDFPRDGRSQLAYEAFHVMQTAGFLSAWDAFHRAVPALQQEGKYTFLPPRESLGDLLTAPFDPEFLARPTTWIHLAYTGLVTSLVLSGREPGVAYEPFRLHDAAFVTSLSLNAGVSEEALFRGWLLPLLHQNLGQRFWLANTLQGSIFGLLHVAGAREFALAISAWAIYEGWLTRRNEWSVRESIFHHVWYDVAVGAATLLADERARIQITFPTIRF